MSIIIGILLIFIAGLLIWKNFSSLNPQTVKKTLSDITAEEALKKSIEAGKKETKNLLENPGPMAETVKAGSSSAVVVLPGTSPVSVDTGEVLTKKGEVANTDASQGRLNSITDSYSVDPKELGGNTIKITINPRSVEPKEFTVHPGQAVSLALSNTASWSEVIIFQDPSLSAVAFSLLPNTTKAITFNAPMRVGEYLFYSNVAEERALGIEGKMIVK